jgi:DNA-binding transcriptional ArsR family regulator
MSGENPQDGFNRDRAELFEALGHPTRIKILQVLSESPLGFSDLKREAGIESNGLLSFHLGKLDGLVKITSEGNYTLSDEGREALRIVATKETINLQPSSKLAIRPSQIIIVVLLIALALTVVVSLYSYTQLNSNNQRLSGLTDLLLTSTNSSSSVPVSEADAIIIALNYGGWNASSLNGMTVSAILTGSNGAYVWTVIVEPVGGYDIPPPGYYYVNAMIGAIIPIQLLA